VRIRPAGGIAAGVLAVVGLPVIIAQATQQGQPPAPEAPAAKTAAAQTATLNIPLSSSEKQGSGEAYLRIAAAGKPPSRPSHLLSGDGSESVRVNADDPSPCKGLPLHRALGQGVNSEWCLRLRGITDAQQVSGKVTGKATDLTLTVSRRTGFFWVPLAAVLGGLILGLALLVVPVWLRNRIRKGLLDKELDENDRSTQQIESLRDWVTGRRNAGEKDDAILPLVVWVRTRGRDIAKDARQKLQQALRVSTLPRDHPFRSAAEERADSTKLKVTDFLKEDGTRTARHPLLDWIEGLATLDSQRRELQRLANTIRMLPPAAQDAPTKALEEAQHAFDAVSKPEEVSPVEAKLADVRRKIPRPAPDETMAAEFRLLPTTEGQVLHLAVAPSTSLGGARIPPAVPEPEPEPPPSPRPVSYTSPDHLAAYRAGTFALVVIVVALAVLTIRQTLYAPIADFGDFGDYFALISAGVTAGVGATVVALLAPWNPTEAAET
jgi:hypothetical protein